MKLSLRVFLVLSAALIVTPCSTDHDCSLNGVCSGSCVCDPGWIGSDCGVLDLRAANPSNGYNLTGSGTSSWGIAGPRQDLNNSKLFHIVTSEFTRDCGTKYWKPYSRLVRAESTTGPQGPYKFAAEVAPPFGHNPTIIYSPADKLWLLYHIGCTAILKAGCGGLSADCVAGTGHGESSILVRSSPDLLNWTFKGEVMRGSGGWDSDTTNPSAYPVYSTSNPTSEMVLAYRGRASGGCGACDEHIGITHAASYLGTFPHPAGPIFSSSDADEDPFVWRDKRGNWHILMHALSPIVGRHGYASSWNGSWTYGSTTAYTTTVKFTNGKTVNFGRRERPQLLLSTDGNLTPLYLTSGVAQGDLSQSYGIIVPIGDGAASYEKSLGF